MNNCMVDALPGDQAVGAVVGWLIRLATRMVSKICLVERWDMRKCHLMADMIPTRPQLMAPLQERKEKIER